MNLRRQDEARALLADLSLCASEIVEDAIGRDPATQLGRYDDYIHLVLSGCKLAGRSFELERVDVVVGEKFLLTMCRGQAVFMQAVRRDFHTDFIRFANSPSFLLFELWDHLVDNYLNVHNDRSANSARASSWRLRFTSIQTNLPSFMAWRAWANEITGACLPAKSKATTVASGSAFVGIMGVSKSCA